MLGPIYNIYNMCIYIYISIYGQYIWLAWWGCSSGWFSVHGTQWTCPKQLKVDQLLSMAQKVRPKYYNPKISTDIYRYSQFLLVIRNITKLQIWPWIPWIALGSPWWPWPASALRTSRIWRVPTLAQPLRRWASPTTCGTTRHPSWTNRSATNGSWTAPGHRCWTRWRKSWFMCRGGVWIYVFMYQIDICWFDFDIFDVMRLILLLWFWWWRQNP